MSKLHELSYTLPVAMAWSVSDDSAIRYVIPVVDDVMFCVMVQIQTQAIGKLFTMTCRGGKVCYSRIALLKCASGRKRAA